MGGEDVGCFGVDLVVCCEEGDARDCCGYYGEVVWTGFEGDGVVLGSGDEVGEYLLPEFFGEGEEGEGLWRYGGWL